MDLSDFSSGMSAMSDTESEGFENLERTKPTISSSAVGLIDMHETRGQGSPVVATASPLSTPLNTPTPLSFNEDAHLLKTVFSFLNSAEDRKHLVPLACTCKLFSELVLDLLWEKQDSLLPLLKLLPTCKTEDNVYILSGHTTSANLSRLSFYAKRVISFTVLDEPTKPQSKPTIVQSNEPQPKPTIAQSKKSKISKGSVTQSNKVQSKPTVTQLNEPQSKPTIAQLTYLRLAQLIPSPLFPSLKHLHVPSVKASLAHIFLFMSPSLRSVELGDIEAGGNASQIATSFIATLPWEAPELQRLILRGPSHISVDALRHITHFKHLETLELHNVSSIEEFTVFQELGVGLSELKTLLIDTRSLAYRGINPASRTVTDTGTNFENLSRLEIVAPVSLINDLLLSVSSTRLDTLVVKPVIDAQSKPPKESLEKQEIHSCRYCDNTTYVCDCGQYYVPPTNGSSQEQEYLTCQWCGSTNYRCRNCSNYYCSPSPSPPQLNPIQPVTPPLREHVALDTVSLQNLQRLFEIMCSRWHCSIHSLTIDLYDASQPSSSRIFVLPGDILLYLSQLGKLELLQVFNWKVEALNNTLQNSPPCWPKIRVLELPLDEYSSPISLSTLGTFAENCPSLQFLQACIDAETIPDIATTVYAFDHGLAKLSVGSPKAIKEHRNLLHIARYLNALFPNIHTVQTHLGPNGDQWIHIRDILMTFQQVIASHREPQCPTSCNGLVLAANHAF